MCFLFTLQSLVNENQVEEHLNFLYRFILSIIYKVSENGHGLLIFLDSIFCSKIVRLIHCLSNHKPSHLHRRTLAQWTAPIP
jgi:hypothetical protein